MATEEVVVVHTTPPSVMALLFLLGILFINILIFSPALTKVKIKERCIFTFLKYVRKKSPNNHQQILFYFLDAS